MREFGGQKLHFKGQGMKKKIFRQAIQAADSLSLGISMVIAILIGVGLGYLLKSTRAFFGFFG